MTLASRFRAHGLRLVVAALALGACGVAARAQGADDARAFEGALQAYRDNHWRDAFAAFARLADRGHPEASRVALQMWTWGPRLYGVGFDASVQQVERWRRQRVAALAGAEPAVAKGE